MPDATMSGLERLQAVAESLKAEYGEPSGSARFHEYVLWLRDEWIPGDDRTLPPRLAAIGRPRLTLIRGGRDA